MALALVAIPLLLGQQWPVTVTQALGAGDFPPANTSGLYERGETSPAGPFRWSADRVTLGLEPLGYPLDVRLRVQGERPADTPPALLGASAGGRSLGAQPLARAPTDVTYRLPAPAMLAINPTLLLTSTVFQPPGDPRRLGTVFYSVETRSSGPSLPAPWPALALLLSGLLAYAAAWAVTRRVSPAWLVALAWGLALGACNALARPWLVFHAWYWPVLPLVVLLLVPWARAAAYRRAHPSVPAPVAPHPLLTAQPWPLAGAVVIAALAVLAWHFVAPQIPSGIGYSDNWAWGAAFYGTLPWPLQAAGVGVVGVALAWAWRSNAECDGRNAEYDGDGVVESAESPSIPRAQQAAPLQPLPPRAQQAALLQLPSSRFTFHVSIPQSAIRNPQSAILAGLVLFSLLPARGSEGDSTEFDRRIPRGDLWREREVLDWYLHAKLWRVLREWLPLPSQVYALVATLAGGVYLAGAGLLGRAMGRTRGEAWTIVAGLCAVGNILLFFGYVESYALLAAGSLFVIWACWRYTEGRIGFGWVGLLATGTALLHGSALWWGLMVFAAWLGRARGLPAARRWRTALAHGGEGVAVGLAVVLLMVSAMLLDGYDWTELGYGLSHLGGGDGHTLMQLVRTETRFEHYTFFSWAHLGGVIQEQLLTAPLALLTIGLALTLAGPGVRALVRAVPPLRTLAVGAAAVFVYSITWNADLGPRSDWDLLSLPALPLTLLAVYLLLHLPPGRARRLALAAYLSVSAVHAAAWVALHALGLPFPAQLP
ncbi:MAG: hypothetical protein M3Z04_10735 [Chloroflexota bacterium]|nr:hypothetical protein [Chloroflexota bacterium]